MAVTDVPLAGKCKGEYADAGFGEIASFAVPNQGTGGAYCNLNYDGQAGVAEGGVLIIVYNPDVSSHDCKLEAVPNEHNHPTVETHVAAADHTTVGAGEFACFGPFYSSIGWGQEGPQTPPVEAIRITQHDGGDDLRVACVQLAGPINRSGIF